MAVGTQASTTQVNQQLTQLALQLRDACYHIANLQTFVVTLGLAGLEALGYSAEDAQAVLNQASYLNTVALVYKGVQFQGPAANSCIQFDFDNELSQLWAGAS